MGIDLVTLLVDDIEVSRAFYRDVIGLSVQKDRGDYIELENPGLRLALYPRRRLAEMLELSVLGEPGRGHAVVLSLSVDRASAVDEAYQKIVSRGARPMRPPEDMPWGPRAAFFLDPDGNLLEVLARPEA